MFVRGDDYRREEIWLADAPGKNPRKIADGRWPAWASDGQSLFFYSLAKMKIMKISVEPLGKPAVLFDRRRANPRHSTTCPCPKACMCIRRCPGSERQDAFIWLNPDRQDPLGLLCMAEHTLFFESLFQLAVGSRESPFFGWSPDGKVFGNVNFFGYLR